MKILVTGGAGFIGTNFVNYCYMKGYDVVVYDSLTYASNPQSLPKAVKLVRGDVCDFLAINALIGNFAPDVVVNFAAQTHVDRSLSSLKNQKEFIRTNADGVLTLCTACFNNGVYFHQISTDEVYGELGLKDKPFTEDSPYKPNNPYSVSKAAGEMFLLAFGRANPDFKWTISNCTNNYGPYQDPEKIIPRFIARVGRNQKVPLFTDSSGVMGKNIRDWIYVTDHCEAILRIINFTLESNKFGEKYNIAGDQQLTNYRLTELILTGMGKKSWEEWIERTKDRPGHDFRYALSMVKIKKLGFKPRVRIKEGLKNVINWYGSQEGAMWLYSKIGGETEI